MRSVASRTDMLSAPAPPNARSFPCQSTPHHVILTRLVHPVHQVGQPASDLDGLSGWAWEGSRRNINAPQGDPSLRHRDNPSLSPAPDRIRNRVIAAGQDDIAAGQDDIAAGQDDMVGIGVAGNSSRRLVGSLCLCASVVTCFQLYPTSQVVRLALTVFPPATPAPRHYRGHWHPAPGRFPAPG